LKILKIKKIGLNEKTQVNNIKEPIIRSYNEGDYNINNICKDSSINMSSFPNRNFMTSSEIKHFEENLKENSSNSSNSAVVQVNNGKNQAENPSAAEAANLKNSIRSLREYDKQAGNIYFKNTKNYGDETISNTDFKSNLIII